jgi:hypothetical protein
LRLATWLSKGWVGEEARGKGVGSTDFGEGRVDYEVGFDDLEGGSA